MERVILIKYGELTTKKGNRNFFVKTLANNIKHKLQDYSVTISSDLSRMYISFNEKDLNKILEQLNLVFGIHSYHVAYSCPSDLQSICDLLTETVEKEHFETFKVVVKRSDKTFPKKSNELAPIFGGVILKNKKNIKVDVHHPEVVVTVEILKDRTLLYYNAYQGLGGYPVGSQPKGLVMLSGGIDSPVATFLAMKRGIKIEAVYFESIPHTSLEAREKVITLVRKLSKYTNTIKLHIIPFTEIQEEIYKNVKDDYVITIMRRMMYRIMEKLAKKEHAYAIINGESVGQVASQTLHSMYVINEVTNMPVLRPVACLDKLEIIDIAKKIDTYETSILPYEDCCTVFVPKHPVINPTLDQCLKEEAKFEFSNLLEKAIYESKTITIKNQDVNEYQELL